MKKIVPCLMLVCSQILMPKAKVMQSREQSTSVEKHRFNDTRFEHRIKSDNGVKHEEFYVNGKLVDQVAYDHEIKRAREQYKKIRGVAVQASSQSIDKMNQDLAVSVGSKQVKRALQSINDTLKIVGQDFLQPHLVFSSGAIHNQARLDDVKKSYESWNKHYDDYVVHKNVDGLNRLWQHLQAIDHELKAMYDATMDKIITTSNDDSLMQKLQGII